MFKITGRETGNPAQIKGTLENPVEFVESLYLEGSQRVDCTDLYTQRGDFSPLSLLSVVDNYCRVTLNDSKQTQRDTQQKKIREESPSPEINGKNPTLNKIFHMKEGVCSV